MAVASTRSHITRQSRLELRSPTAPKIHCKSPSSKQRNLESFEVLFSDIPHYGATLESLPAALKFFLSPAPRSASICHRSLIRTKEQLLHRVKKQEGNLLFFVTCALVGISCRRSRSSLVRTNDQLYTAKVKHGGLRSGARRCRRRVRR